jgi:ubiquinone biosynthesis protein UbiJ
MADQRPQSQTGGAWLLAHAQVQEQPFRSSTPAIGPLLARLRAAWNSVATKWYVRPLLAQQNDFNRLVAQQIGDQGQQLIALDREQTQHSHDTAALAAQVVQLERRLHSLEERLAQIESDGRAGDTG